MSRQQKPIEEIDKRVLQNLVDLLFFQYPKARESIISYESRANKVPAYAFTEMRDFIDHINLALHQDLSENIPHHLAQAEEHLRRCVVEPYQGVVHAEIKEIEKLFKKYEESWFSQLPYVKVKALKLNEYHAYKREIHDLVANGRTLKACNIWSDDFESAIQDCFIPAYDKCLSLKQMITDSLQTSQERKERVLIAFIVGLFLNFCILAGTGLFKWIFS